MRLHDERVTTYGELLAAVSRLTENAMTRASIPLALMSTVVLSSGPVTSTDVLSVELVQSIELPDMIMVRWPTRPPS